MSVNVFGGGPQSGTDVDLSLYAKKAEVAAAVAPKLDRSGGLSQEMSGDLFFDSPHTVRGLPLAPDTGNSATSKAYVDERTQLALDVANDKLPLVGGVLTGVLGMNGSSIVLSNGARLYGLSSPAAPDEAANRGWCESRFVSLDGITVPLRALANITFDPASPWSVTGLPTPLRDTDAVPKR